MSQLSDGTATFKCHHDDVLLCFMSRLRLLSPFLSLFCREEEGKGPGGGPVMTCCDQVDGEVRIRVQGREAEGKIFPLQAQAEPVHSCSLNSNNGFLI